MSVGSSPITIDLTGKKVVRAFATLIHVIDNYYGPLAPKTTGGTATYILDASIGAKPPIEASLTLQECVTVRFALLNKLYPIDDGRLGLHVKDLFITDATRRHGVGVGGGANGGACKNFPGTRL